MKSSVNIADLLDYGPIVWKDTSGQTEWIATINYESIRIWFEEDGHWGIIATKHLVVDMNSISLNEAKIMAELFVQEFMFA